MAPPHFFFSPDRLCHVAMHFINSPYHVWRQCSTILMLQVLKAGKRVCEHIWFKEKLILKMQILCKPQGLSDCYHFHWPGLILEELLRKTSFRIHKYSCYFCSSQFSLHCGWEYVKHVLACLTHFFVSLSRISACAFVCQTGLEWNVALA